ncbi:uncharacterized protein LOC100902345 [Galendromus occidentalis]|uniref:Uncharacterized protein LOC100902345 n=1 Tax=Galendromus occidentalis TaxID=34638 RepID=A0AAJ6QQL9_9ACAR|nr:uncharacterized protein LOC100902345 [Galendromus occidentalis]
MTILCGAGTVFMDGTFRIVPRLFLQLYTIHAFFMGQMIPFVYFLLPNKQEATYRRMFCLLKALAASLGLSFNPRVFQLDFEVATLKAIRREFSTADLKGCNFHFQQCLWRKIQELGLSRQYREPGVKCFVRSIGALALVPLSLMDEAWLEINAEAPSTDHPAYSSLENFKEYFIHTWLENPSVFPRTLWNHYGKFESRTTNHVEGWHQAINTALGKKHGNIYEIISLLQRQQQKFEEDMLQLRMGGKPPRKSKKFEELNRKLRVFVEHFETNQVSLIQYIHSVGFNLSF